MLRIKPIELISGINTLVFYANGPNTDRNIMHSLSKHIITTITSIIINTESCLEKRLSSNTLTSVKTTKHINLHEQALFYYGICTNKPINN